MSMTIGAQRARATSSPLNQLLGGLHIGHVFDIDYTAATVLTNDEWKRQAGGVPEFCFLLATSRLVDQPGDPDREEVILLRVEGTCPLPQQSELVEIRESAARHRALFGDADPDPAVLLNRGIAAVPVDPTTRDRMQYSGLRCRVLGTFYTDIADNGVEYLAFGSDLDNVYAASAYRVHKPDEQALHIIASYPLVSKEEAEEEAASQLVPVGYVRYSSTRRRAKLHDEHEVPVSVRVEDFIEQKTAIFGMTRTGKSNTVKTLCTSIFRHAHKTGKPIGQLLFDPQGEYANVQQQDKTALSQLGTEYVSIYRYGLKEDEDGNRLQLNFYDPVMLGPARQIIGDVLMSGASNVKYISRFVGANLDDPDPADYSNSDDFNSAKTHVQRARMFFYGLLAKADFAWPRGHRLTLKMAQSIATRIVADTGAGIRVDNGWIAINSRQDLVKVCEWLVLHKDDGNATASGTIAYWLREEATQAVLAVFESGTGRAGIARIREVEPFHSPRGEGDFAVDIYKELKLGRIVIVELSRGTRSILQAISERIIRHVLEEGGKAFRANQNAPRMQIVIEEAHTLFEKSKFNNANDDRDPYVMLARMASKLKIGLLYATQEVRSVADEVMSNTYNIVVAHLNSKNEVDALSKYYDFGAFADAIRGSEDKGFVRLKTMSGRFIVPVQIAKFDEGMIAEARSLASAHPLHVSSAPVARQAAVATSRSSAAPSMGDPLPF